MYGICWKWFWKGWKSSFMNYDDRLTSISVTFIPSVLNISLCVQHQVGTQTILYWNQTTLNRHGSRKGIVSSATAHCITYAIKCGKSGSVEGLGELEKGWFLSFFLSVFLSFSLSFFLSFSLSYLHAMRYFTPRVSCPHHIIYYEQCILVQFTD